MGNVEGLWANQPEIKLVTSLDLPSIEEKHLQNGVPLTVVHDRRSNAFRLDIIMGAGQLDQHKLLQASTTCRMLKEGTSKLSSQQLAEKLDFYGAWLETSTYFLYSRITLYSLEKYADETLALVEALVRDSVFPEHEFNIVNNSNKAYAQVVASKSNVKAQRALLGSLFGSHHICGRFAQEEDYEKLRVEDLRDFYESFYNSSDCHLFFSGEMTPHLLDRIECSFGKNAWGGKQEHPLRQPLLHQMSSVKRTFVECPSACQSSVRMGCFLMPRTEKDFLVANFFNTLLGGFFGSRLMTELREKKGFTYGISSTVSLYPYDTLLLIASETSSEHIDALIDGVYHEIERLQEELVSPQELSLVKNYYISDLCRTYEEPFAMADYCISMNYFGLPYDLQTKAVERVKSLSAEDLRAFARKWLHLSDFREAVSGKR